MNPEIPFGLKYVSEVLSWSDASKEPTQSDSGRNAGAMSPKSSAGDDSRIQNWAALHAKTCSAGAFAQTLDGRQVDGELGGIFRDDMRFGRSLAERLVPYHDHTAKGEPRCHRRPFSQRNTG